MKTIPAFLALALVFSANISHAAKGLWTDPKDSTLPVDFQIQGEYVGELSCGCELGAQVIALGNGEFQAVLYPLGLPGADWERGDERSVLIGKLEGKKAVLKSVVGKRRYLGNKPSEFSATNQFPPQGQKDGSATIENGKMAGKHGKKTFELKRIVRKSPT
ncbi:uncharacterized protein METZ01_LOCUS435320, partial [marine metagenome]